MLMLRSRISQALANWFDTQTQLEGVVVSGDARCRLSTNPDNIVGIDVAIFLGEEALGVVELAGTFEGPPLLAVEVLSPTDTHEKSRREDSALSGIANFSALDR